MIYLYLLLLRIVAYLEGPSKIISFIVVLLLMSVSILKRTTIKLPLKASKLTVLSFFLVLGIIAHSLVLNEVRIADIAILLTYWFWLVFMMAYFKGKDLNQCLRYILVSFFIYNLANYFFFLMYFAEQKIGVNSIMGMLGIYGYRIYFPLSSGANIFTSQLALNALIALYFIKLMKGYKRVIYLSIYIFYIYMLILADSRLILIFALIFSHIYWFSLKRTLSFLKRYWYLLILILITTLYVFYSTDIFDAFKRSGEKTEKNLTRIEIWTLAFQVIFDDFKFLIGHGLNAFKSNIPDDVFREFENQSLETSHNFIIQSIIDYGLIGILFILDIIFKLLKMINKLKYRIITIIMTVILLLGATESIPSFYSFEPTLFFISLSALIVTIYERETN